MVLHRATGEIEHRGFRDLCGYLRPNDCLVLNATRVVPARFTARRATGGRIDGLFLREAQMGRWEVLLDGARRLKDGEWLEVSSSAGNEIGPSDQRASLRSPLLESSGTQRPCTGPWSIRLLRRLERGICEVELSPAASVAQVLDAVGATPLPPYIRRAARKDVELAALDRSRYQTVYARSPGAVAAPTAGLHFTNELFDALHRRGVTTAEVVLHVGLGTFQPVEVEDLAEHKMHAEWFELPDPAARAIESTRAAGGRIVAVGTTSVRVLETCCRSGADDGEPHQVACGTGFQPVDKPCGTGFQPMVKHCGTGYLPVNKHCGTGYQPVNQHSGTGYQPLNDTPGAGIMPPDEHCGTGYQPVTPSDRSARADHAGHAAATESALAPAPDHGRGPAVKAAHFVPEAAGPTSSSTRPTSSARRAPSSPTSTSPAARSWP